MKHTLSFDVIYMYKTSNIGITLPVELSLGGKRVTIPDAKVDTGATFCIFQREYGEILGLKIETGLEERIMTTTGSFLAYGHDISLSTLDFQFDVMVYFASSTGFYRNVLGQRGWLQQMRLGIIDYEGKLYASRYDN